MPRFIVFEGIDGSGKSTVAHACLPLLGEVGAVLTEEPTKSWLGDAVRKAHQMRENPVTEAFLFMADRASHNEKIRKWLSEGLSVVCDRYYHSTVAYQSAAIADMDDSDSFEWLLEINRRISIEPDLVFLLDIDPETAIDRVNRRGEQSKFEKLAFLEKVADNYRRLARSSKNIQVIDASDALNEVVSEISRRL